MPARTLSLEGGQIMRSHIAGPGGGWIMRSLEGKSGRESLKRTISANSGLGLLQMISEPDTKRWASKDAGPEGGWIVRSHIDWRWERVPARTLSLEGGGS